MPRFIWVTEIRGDGFFFRVTRRTDRNMRQWSYKHLLPDHRVQRIYLLSNMRGVEGPPFRVVVNV